jgi:isocitrate dehydrogenase (NAD+)
MMLNHIGEADAATRIQTALNKVIQARKTVTRDLGGSATTTEFTDAVIAAL